jgi:hypothetical protein
VFYYGDIVAFTGLPGAGKTGLMTDTAIQVCTLFGMELRTNYSIWAYPSKRIKKFQDLQATATLLCIDELQLVAGSRDFAKAANKTISEFVELDVRKPGNILFYTAQDFDMVDINVRRLTSYVFDLQRIRELTQQLGGGTRSICTAYQNMRYGNFKQISRFVVEYSIFIGKYDTADRDVRIG